MAQYITLEEAAQRLGLSTDDFKRRLKTEWTHMVPMRDGSTLRFRVNQVDELSRQLGGASDPALPLADAPAVPGSDDFKVPPAARGGGDEPLVFEGTDDDIFSLAGDEPGAARKPGKGDSDVRLEAPGRKGKPPEHVPTEEIALDLAGPGSAVIKGGGGAKLTPPPSSGKLSAPDSGKKLSGGLSGDGAKNLSSSGGGGDSSEFELSLDADSDDFELQLNTDSSDEVDLGSSPVETGGAGKSGINLRDPADSGIPLEAKKPASGKVPPAAPRAVPDSDPDLDFELTLDPGPASGSRSAGPKSGGKAPVTSDSDSEFELTLDGSGSGSSLEAAALESAEADKGDIFETDFEIPPMADESGSEAVAVDSDTDLEEGAGVAVDEGDDTGSQVVEIEEEVDQVVDLGTEEDEPVRVSRPAADEDAPITVPAAPLKPRPWGVVPALILFPTVVLTLLGTLMGFELLRTMTGYQQPRKPAAPLVRWVAGTVTDDLKDQ